MGSRKWRKDDERQAAMSQRRGVRVYELARELGLENEVVLAACLDLRVGAKSHSSEIDEPSADRVRRFLKAQ